MSKSDLSTEAQKMIAENAVEVSISGPTSKSGKSKIKKKKEDPVDDLVRLTAATIGIISEIVHHQKEKRRFEKVEEAAKEEQSSDVTIGVGLSSDQHQQSQPVSTPLRSPSETSESKSPQKQKPTNLTTAFLSRHPISSPYPTTFQQLSSPVIIPQRRPNTRTRGFFRAYPPVLSTRGISQSTFLDFIDTLNAALVPNPWLNAINLVGEVGNAAPDPLTMVAIGVGVGVVVEGCVEANSRMKGSEFLERANREFWGVRGLVCKVVRWRDGEEYQGEKDDGDHDGVGGKSCIDHEELEGTSQATFTETMKKVMRKPASYKTEAQRLQQHFQASLMSSNDVFSSQTFAPLVFPDPDEEANDITTLADTSSSKTSQSKIPNAFKRADAWMDEYMDKHAQARWVHEHENRTLAEMVPKPEFRSRYADPSHSACSGDVLALLTGGRWSLGCNAAKSDDNEGVKENEDADEDESNTEDGKKKEGKVKTEKEKLKEEAKRKKKEEAEIKARQRKAEKEKMKEKSMSKILSSLLENDMLYLMIVDMPSAYGAASRNEEGASRRR